MIVEYELSYLARNDLEKIWNFTTQSWSIKHADKYYLSIIERIETICHNPKIGRSIKEIKKLKLFVIPH